VAGGSESNWRPGVAARRASRPTLILVFELLTVLAGAVWTVPLGAFITGDWDALLMGGLAAGVVGLVWRHTRRRLNARAQGNGSFYYLSALPHGSIDHDIQRFRRAIRDGTTLGGAPVFTQTQTIERRLNVGESNWWPALREVQTDLRFALREDDPESPVNLLVNAAWPVALALGASLGLGDDSEIPMPGSALRIWYLVDGSVFAADPTTLRDLRRSAYERELLDTIDVASLPAEPKETCDPGTSTIWFTGTKAGVPHHWNQNPPPVFVESDTYPIGPDALADYATRCAQALLNASLRTEKITVRALVPKPVAVAIGLQLWKWKKADEILPRLICQRWDESAQDWLEITFTPPGSGHASAGGVATAPINTVVTAPINTWVNLTPHPITFVSQSGDVTIEAGPTPARIDENAEEATPAGEATAPAIFEVTLGAVTGLPEPEEGVGYIVSRPTAMRVTGRADVFFPFREVRDDEGRITGCEGLGRLT